MNAQPLYEPPFDRLVYELKQKIIAFADNTQNIPASEELAEAWQSMETLIRKEITEVFENGVEFGREWGLHGIDHSDPSSPLNQRIARYLSARSRQCPRM